MFCHLSVIAVLFLYINCDTNQSSKRKTEENNYYLLKNIFSVSFNKSFPNKNSMYSIVRDCLWSAFIISWYNNYNFIIINVQILMLLLPPQGLYAY